MLVILYMVLFEGGHFFSIASVGAFFFFFFSPLTFPLLLLLSLKKKIFFGVFQRVMFLVTTHVQNLEQYFGMLFDHFTLFFALLPFISP